MISDMDETLRELLIQGMPVRNGEINIEFDQPRREWSARLSRPTLNVFLYDVRENTVLRQADWQVERRSNGTALKTPPPVRVDLNYLVTAWATEPDDEHRLLSRALLALLRYSVIPTNLLPESLQSQPVPIPLRVADLETLRNAADLWGVLDNELRPAIPCTLTLAFDPYQPVTGPLVRSRHLRVQQASGMHAAGKQPPSQLADVHDYAGDGFWLVGGVLRGEKPLQGIHLVLRERGLDVPVSDRGEFVIGNLEAGEYTLELERAGKVTRRQIIVPSESYDFDL